jgi:hypothetical protein
MVKRIIKQKPRTPVVKVNLPTGDIIRDKEFAKRLLIACEGNTHCPTVGRGKQKWLREEIEQRFGKEASASPEAMRKYFAGIMRPRPKLMSHIAEVLEVDEGWLSLGIKADFTPLEQRRHNAMASGAANIVAGLIQLNGGYVAFPDEGKKADGDLFAIIAGKQVKVDVRLIQETKDHEFRLDIDAGFDDRIVLALLPAKAPNYFRLFRIETDAIKSHGKRRGDFWQLVLEKDGSKYKAGETLLADVTDFTLLNAKSSQPRQMSIWDARQGR